MSQINLRCCWNVSVSSELICHKPQSTHTSHHYVNRLTFVGLLGLGCLAGDLCDWNSSRELCNCSLSTRWRTKRKKKHISVSKRQRAERAYSRVESKNGAKRLNWWIEIRQHAVNIYLFLHRRHIHFILNLVYPVDQSRGPCAIATVCPCVFISTCSRSRPKPNHLIKWWIEW